MRKYEFIRWVCVILTGTMSSRREWNKRHGNGPIREKLRLS